MSRYRYIKENSVRINKTMFMLPEEDRPPYVGFRIEKEDDKEILYLRFLREREGNCVCLTKKKGSLVPKKGYYYSPVPFNIVADTEIFELIPTTIDKIEYNKIGKKLF